MSNQGISVSTLTPESAGNKDWYYYVSTAEGYKAVNIGNFVGKIITKGGLNYGTYAHQLNVPLIRPDSVTYKFSNTIIYNDYLRVFDNKSKEVIKVGYPVKTMVEGDETEWHYYYGDEIKPLGKFKEYKVTHAVVPHVPNENVPYAASRQMSGAPYTPPTREYIFEDGTLNSEETIVYPNDNGAKHKVALAANAKEKSAKKQQSKKPYYVQGLEGGENRIKLAKTVHDLIYIKTKLRLTDLAYAKKTVGNLDELNSAEIIAIIIQLIDEIFAKTGTKEEYEKTCGARIASGMDETKNKDIETSVVSFLDKKEYSKGVENIGKDVDIDKLQRDIDKCLEQVLEINNVCFSHMVLRKKNIMSRIRKGQATYNFNDIIINVQNLKEHFEAHFTESCAAHFGLKTASAVKDAGVAAAATAKKAASAVLGKLRSLWGGRSRKNQRKSRRAKTNRVARTRRQNKFSRM